MNFYDQLNRMKKREVEVLSAELEALQYGSPQEIFSYIQDMPIIIGGIRLDDRFLVICEDKNIFIAKSDELRYCFISPEEYDDREPDALWVEGRGRAKEFMVGRKWALQVYELINNYCRKYEKSYENWECQYRPFTLSMLSPLGRPLNFNKDTFTILTRERKGLKIIKKEVEYKTQEIIWCEQYKWYDTENSDSYFLRLYMLDGTIHEHISNPAIGYFRGCCNAVLHLRDNIPHLLYGSNPEYKEIFQRNPAELMKIAKKEMQERNADSSSR